MSEYIDREALLLELIEELEFESPMYSTEQNKWFNSGLKCAIKDVKSQTSADVIEVKHGHWKEVILHNGCTPDYDCICSFCGKSGLPCNSFCPNYGAKMDQALDWSDKEDGQAVEGGAVE